MLDADDPWKEVCEKKLPLVFELLYRRVHRGLDWTRDYENLDQELRKLVPDMATGKRIADRLIKAFDRRRDKEKSEARYFHLEVQGKKEKDFERRMHVYNYRSEDRFGQPVVSLAILVDEDPGWRPSRYVAGFYPVNRKPTGNEVAPDDKPAKRRRRYLAERTLRFLTVKLLDFRGREAALEALDNPMGLFVVAHLEAMRTRGDEAEREKVKLRLLRNLRARKMDEEDFRFWESCFDWFLQLPRERDRVLWDELERMDREQNMPFVSYAERRGLEQGLEQGLEKGTRQALGMYLKIRFGEDAPPLLALLEQVSGSEAQLEQLCKRIFQAGSPETVRSILSPPPDAPSTQP